MTNEFFETIKVLDGKHYNVEYHQMRYEKTLKSFGIKEFKKLDSFFKEPGAGLYRCKIVYDLDDIKSIEYFEYNKRDISSLKLINCNDIEYNLKSSNRDYLNMLFEQKDQCDDILIVKDGLVTDTSIANVAFYKDSTWYTPTRPLLEGTTRNRYLDQSKLVEKDISVNELDSFESIALLNAMIDFDIIQINEGGFFVN